MISNLYCIGINHRTAPIEVREKLWFSNDEIRSILPKLKQLLSECVLISTCNRTELYLRLNEGNEDIDAVWSVLTEFKGAQELRRDQCAYTLRALSAVKHLLKLAAGIDSMVLGDVQILNQIKTAFALSQETHTTGIILNRLFHSALHIGKRVRTETEIGDGAISVGYAAAELVSKIFQDLSQRTALLIGAGETGELTAKHLRSQQLGELLIANRTRERAETLSRQLNGTVVEFEEANTRISNVDIIIASTGSSSYLLRKEDLYRAMQHRGNRPLIVIDLGVPRNIDPAAQELHNVFLHDIDALDRIVDTNFVRRQAEIPKVQHIVFEGIVEFHTWIGSLELTPTIRDLREQFEVIRQSEVEKFRSRFGEDTQEEVAVLTRRIVNKILHTPMVTLKERSAGGEHDELYQTISLIRSLFGLERKERGTIQRQAVTVDLR